MLQTTLLIQFYSEESHNYLKYLVYSCLHHSRASFYNAWYMKYFKTPKVCKLIFDKVVTDNWIIFFHLQVQEHDLTHSVQVETWNHAPAGSATSGMMMLM